MTAKSNFNLLPDGTSFRFWDCRTSFTRTYHVDCGHPRACDDNPGTAEQPLRTIGRAAELLQPGERVLIGTGVYRECVRPARGGNSPDEMISYEAAPGARPVISGAEVWQGPWAPSEGWRLFPRGERSAPNGPRAWQGALPACSMPGYNPFGMSNAPNTPWGKSHFYDGIPSWAPRDEFMMRRGLLFVDGKPIEQAFFPYEKGLRPGTFWIEDSGLVVHFRLDDDGDPADRQIEFTAREQCFTPAAPYRGYIRVRGLAFEKVGNGFPPPQRGALSTFCGHHWIIEDNTVRWANSIGIDIGQQAPQRTSEQLQGHHVVRRNTITDCGVCGIAGVGAARIPAVELKAPDGHPVQITDTLIERNRFERICGHNTESMWESAAIKIHSMQDCLVRRNIVLDNGYGAGIWADWQTVNSRICGNVLIDLNSAMMGAIFVEASKHPNEVDNNVIWRVHSDTIRNNDPVGGGHGVYEHDCERLIVRHNFIHGAEGAGVFLNRGSVDRIDYGRGATGRRNNVHNNIITNCGMAIVFPCPDNSADGNLFGTFTRPAPLRIQQPDERLNLAAWREFHGWDVHGRNVEIDAQLDRERLTLTIRIADGADAVERQIDLQDEFSLEDLFPAEADTPRPEK